jgi:2-oxoglutarate decarboxylase
VTETATVQIQMPEMGESVSEGIVLEWHVAEGDFVREGDTVVEVSTDKVDAEVPAPADGTIVKLLAGVDDEVAVGAPLAELELGGAGTAEGAGERRPAGSDVGGNGADGVRATPVARRVAEELGVDVSALAGSGPGAKVTKEDVLAAAEGNGAVAAAGAVPAAEGEARALRGPAALAAAMDESRSVPTATSFRTIEVDTLAAKRGALNGLLAERGEKLSFTHLIAWAIVRAAGAWPAMTRTFEQRDGRPFAIEGGPVNLGIAVDVERRDGSRSLVVPAIKGAEQLGFAAFHTRYEELVSGAREGTLGADDLEGTNITLTNPGGIGTVASVPRLLRGQSAIVAAGAIAYPAEWAHASPEALRRLGVSKTMTLTSTYDHRVIQGAESGAFLRRVEQLLRGEDGFYEGIASELGIDPAPLAAAQPEAGSAPPIEAAPAPAAVPAAAPDEELLRGVEAATSLLMAHRTHGHLAAHLDPLGSQPRGDPALEPQNLGLTPELMARIPASVLRIGAPGETLLEALPRIREAYCGTIAYQFEHLSSHRQRSWLREMVESGAHRRPLGAAEKRRLLERLIDVFEFERFLERTYLGQKVFALEGLDATVPMLDELITLAHRAGAEEVVCGMAHRGRLSVLAHSLGRPIEAILAEFEGVKRIEAVKTVAAIPHGGTGDVKYHYGHRGIYETSEGERIRVQLYPNPSHLEFVDPVVLGGARFIQSEFEGTRLTHRPKRAVPILLHGDAAFPGQGVVAETLNLQALRGYATGGTIHIIQNNQIGFTTDPEDGRSTPYAADMAKGFDIPIVHVNADDVEACSAAARLAAAYREHWGRDIVIDVIGYRRYGHNETDEPAYTQPLAAAGIREHPPVSELYAERLAGEGIVSREDVERAHGRRHDEMSGALQELRRRIERGEYLEDPTLSTTTGELDRSPSPPVETAVAAARLRELNAGLLEVPAGFAVHRKLRKPLARRAEALERGGIEFGHAEALAFASLLAEGVHIRLTGQDTERGTFSQRHLVLHDERSGQEYCPMQSLEQARAPFELYNSPLSELACVGFEYGYSAASPDSLVIWEAQFGDFANAAQVIIDSFMASGEAKWGQSSRLTLLLPHGYEGAGPEHSSARIERFLALGAEGNIRIACPSTAAQYFHLLRRQALVRKPRPLVAFTPKSLLRLDRTAASLAELSGGSFQLILDDPAAAERRERVERLVLCTGKVYFDIDASPRRAAAQQVAIARVELLYPFAEQQLRELIASYPSLREVVWVQEEPLNMGAWKVMSRRLPDVVPDGVELGHVGRPTRASPGEGYSVSHAREQERIVLSALTPGA